MKKKLIALTVFFVIFLLVMSMIALNFSSNSRMNEEFKWEVDEARFDNKGKGFDVFSSKNNITIAGLGSSAITLEAENFNLKKCIGNNTEAKDLIRESPSATMHNKKMYVAYVNGENELSCKYRDAGNVWHQLDVPEISKVNNYDIEILSFKDSVHIFYATSNKALRHAELDSKGNWKLEDLLYFKGNAIEISVAVHRDEIHVLFSDVNRLVNLQKDESGWTTELIEEDVHYPEALVDESELYLVYVKDGDLFISSKDDGWYSEKIFSRKEGIGRISALINNGIIHIFTYTNGALAHTYYKRDAWRSEDIDKGYFGPSSDIEAFPVNGDPALLYIKDGNIRFIKAAK